MQTVQEVKTITRSNYETFFLIFVTGIIISVFGMGFPNEAVRNASGQIFGSCFLGIILMTLLRNIKVKINDA